MKRIGTQRFYIRIMGHTFFIGTETDKTHEPYLLIAEEDVKECIRTHVRKMSPVDRWCENCGAFKGGFTTRWIKPRILRVARGKK